MPKETSAIFTCPKCGKATNVEMPTTSCQHFFECPHCKAMITPKEGECCVFCSYADKKCPVKQKEASE